jgi:hypothetical protein
MRSQKQTHDTETHPMQIRWYLPCLSVNQESHVKAGTTKYGRSQWTLIVVILIRYAGIWVTYKISISASVNSWWYLKSLGYPLWYCQTMPSLDLNNTFGALLLGIILSAVWVFLSANSVRIMRLTPIQTVWSDLRSNVALLYDLFGPTPGKDLSKCRPTLSGNIRLLFLVNRLRFSCGLNFI